MKARLILAAQLMLVANVSAATVWPFPPWAGAPTNGVPRDVQVHSVSGLTPGDPLDPADPKAAPLLKFLNDWVHFIDAQLRRSNVYDFVNIPVPNVMVIQNSFPDAIASNSPTCFNVKVRFSNHKATNETPGIYLPPDNTTLFRVDPRSPGRRGEITAIDNVSEDDCVHEDVADKDLDALAQLLATYSACPVQVYREPEESGLQLKNCHLSSASIKGSFDGAGILMISLESNWVTLTTGMLNEFTSLKDVLAVLTHEMSHYYNAHLVAKSSDFGYFYTETRDRKGPPSQVSHPEMENWPFELDTLLKGFMGVERTNFDNGTYASLIPVAVNFASRGTLPVCKALQVSAAKLTPDSPLLTCLESIPVSRDIVPQEGSVGLFDIDSEIQQATRGHASASVIAQGATNLKEVFVALNQEFLKRVVRTDELLRQERELSLGHYSFEQEADEKSLFALNLIGESPYASISMILHLGIDDDKQTGAPLSPVKSSLECSHLFDETNFTWKNSDYPYVHLGTISNPHHSHCYRAKDIFDRIQANGYSRSSVLDESKFGEWAPLLAYVKAVNPAKITGSKKPALTQLKQDRVRKAILVNRLPPRI